MSNYSEVRAGTESGSKSANYQRDLNNKVVDAINKAKQDGKN